VEERDLAALLEDVESDRSERTITTTNTDKLGEAICAFANDLPNHRQPGYLFVGAREDGMASGASITDQLLQNLAALRSDGNLLPQPRMHVTRKHLGGGEMAVVEVFPSDLPPVRYKQRVWIRVGPRRALATEADERALSERRSAHARTWDMRACAAADLSDLALYLFEAYKLDAIARDVLEENHRTLEDQLASLRFLDRRSGKPTNAAVLVFGKDALGVAPGAYVQYVRYDGSSPGADVVRERRLTGDLGSIMRELGQLAEEIASGRPVDIGPLQEAIVFDFPPAALREVLVNAVLHRDYESNTPVMISHFDDRIEIQNPGGLYGDARPEDFPGVTAYRNPVLAEVAKVMGFVNKYGRGVPRTVEAMRKNASPPPEFSPGSHYFLVILRRRP
jgi:ATP-dependent DNA helicase RecG